MSSMEVEAKPGSRKYGLDKLGEPTGEYSGIEISNEMENSTA
jgi:hypothetical protein